MPRPMSSRSATGSTIPMNRLSETERPAKSAPMATIPVTTPAQTSEAATTGGRALAAAGPPACPVR